MKIAGGHDYEIIYLRPSQIRYAPYQRKIKVAKVEQIAKQFNGDVYNQPDISYRDGCYWCVDGQHTIAAWQLLYGDKPMPCKVYKGMTYSEEAALFSVQDGIETRITPLEYFKAKIEEGDKHMTNVLSGAEAAGYEIATASKKNPRRIAAIGALIDAYDALGYKGYCEMMRVLASAWPNNMDAIRGNVIGGLAIFFQTYYGEFAIAELIKILRKPGSQPIDLINYARAIGQSHRKEIAKAILARYNVKRTTHRLVDKI